MESSLGERPMEEIKEVVLNRVPLVRHLRLRHHLRHRHRNLKNAFGITLGSVFGLCGVIDISGVGFCSDVGI